jgi:hypothetical protein
VKADVFKYEKNATRINRYSSLRFEFIL